MAYKRQPPCAGVIPTNIATICIHTVLNICCFGCEDKGHSTSPVAECACARECYAIPEYVLL
jgi:hypothetical protein